MWFDDGSGSDTLTPGIVQDCSNSNQIIVVQSCIQFKSSNHDLQHQQVII